MDDLSFSLRWTLIGLGIAVVIGTFRLTRWWISGITDDTARAIYFWIIALVGVLPFITLAGWLLQFKTMPADAAAIGVMLAALGGSAGVYAGFSERR